ncbi:AraC family transcriptional regulator [Bacillus sp. sid0103]|nr:AraC family transcriptional regulator [Bacillus sp. sid0103]
MALKLEFTPSEILKVLREFQMGVDKKENAKRDMYVSKIEPSLLDAVTRLARLLDTPKDILLILVNLIIWFCLFSFVLSFQTRCFLLEQYRIPILKLVNQAQ